MILSSQVLFAYGYGANVPSTAKRRMMQSVHLARRVLALERANVSQRRTIEATENRAKTLAEELDKANKLMEDSQQPYGYIIQTVKIKDEEVAFCMLNVGLCLVEFIVFMKFWSV